MEVDALLDMGSLAGDFIAEDLVVRYNLKPVLSYTSYTVCSGLDNRCLKSNTILLLRVTEVVNRYDTLMRVVIGMILLISKHTFLKLPPLT